VIILSKFLLLNNNLSNQSTYISLDYNLYWYYSNIFIIYGRIDYCLYNLFIVLIGFI